MFKLLVQLIFKAGLLSLVVCLLSLLAEAQPNAQVLPFKSARAQNHGEKLELKTMEESIEALKQASENVWKLTQVNAAEEAINTAKKDIITAIDTFGGYQFPPKDKDIERNKIDSLITALLLAYPADAEITAAASMKLAELSHTIFNRRTSDSYLRFLNYQIQTQIPASRPEDWPKFLSLLEASKSHSSQLDMLTLFYTKTADPGLKVRIFNQIYKVLIDPELHWSGQFSPLYLVLSGLRTFLTSELTSEQYMKILDLFIRAETAKHIDPISQEDITRLMMKYAELRVEFEDRVIQRINAMSQQSYILQELSKQLALDIPLTDVQENILRKIKLKADWQISIRMTMLGEKKPSNIIQLKRAAPLCRSFYGR